MIMQQAYYMLSHHFGYMSTISGLKSLAECDQVNNLTLNDLIKK